MDRQLVEEAAERWSKGYLKRHPKCGEYIDIGQGNIDSRILASWAAQSVKIPKDVLKDARYFADNKTCSCDPEVGVTDCMGCSMDRIVTFLLKVYDDR